MRQTVKLRTVTLALAAALAACASVQSRPEIVRYQLVPQTPALSLPTSLRIEVDKVDGGEPFTNTGIAYQISPYRLDSYHYNRWNSPPTEMVAAALQEMTQPTAAAESAGGETVLALSAQIKAFQEVDLGGDFQGLVEIRYCLAPNRKPDQPIWCTVSRHQTAAAAKTPEASVAAINTSFNQSLADLSAQLSANAPNLMKSAKQASAERASM